MEDQETQCQSAPAPGCLDTGTVEGQVRPPQSQQASTAKHKHRAQHLSAETEVQWSARLTQMHDTSHQRLHNVQKGLLSDHDKYLYHDGWLHDTNPLHIQPWVVKE